MANNIIITKLANGNVEVVDSASNSSYSLTPNRSIWDDRGGTKVIIKGIDEDDTHTYTAAQVLKVIRADGTEITISNQDTLYAELKEFFFFSTAGLGGGILNTPVADIDTTFVADYPLVTVGPTKIMYVTRAAMLLTAKSGGGNRPRISIGTNSPDFDNILFPVQLIGLNDPGDVFLVNIEGVVLAASAGQVITGRVDSASGSSVYTITLAIAGNIITA